MLIQVIHCHPLTDSYNHVLFQTIIGALKDKSHEVAATDLYREQFDPAMSVSEAEGCPQPAINEFLVCRGGSVR